MSTSLTDRPDWLEFCKKAASDPEVFKTFRRHPACRGIVETVTPVQGLAYLQEIQKDEYAPVHEYLLELLKNDNVGDPELTVFGSMFASPTTLRYIKVLCDLRRLFGEHAEHMNTICEIGGGYGGQCRIIKAKSAFLFYEILDLQPALDLTGKFLSQFKVEGGFHLHTLESHCDPKNDFLPRDFGLVISNYAFSELRREVQTEYFDKVIQHAKRGYFTMNDITPPEYRSMSAEELAGRMKGRVIPEVPLTAPGNSIVVWGDKA